MNGIQIIRTSGTSFTQRVAGVVLPATMCLLLLLMGAHGVSADVHVIQPDLTWLADLLVQGKIFEDASNGYRAGFEEINSKGGVHNGTHKIFMTSCNSSDNPEVLALARNQSYLAILGWIAVEIQRDDAEAELIRENIMSLGTMAQEPHFFDWHPQFSNAFVSKHTELFAAVNLLLGVYKLKRVALFSMRNGGGDHIERATEFELLTIREGFAAMNMEPVFHLEVDATAPAESIGADALKVLPFNPQAIIMVGYPDVQAASVMAGLHYSGAVPPGFIMTGTNVWVQVAKATFEFLNETTKNENIRILGAGSSPPLSDAGISTMVRRGIDAVKTYWGNASHVVTQGEMAGYQLARFFVELLEVTPELTRAGLRKSLYSNTIIQIDDFSHGVFSEEQHENSVVLPIGRCNQGGKVVFFEELTRNLSSVGLGPSARFQVNSLQCRATTANIRRPVYVPTIIRDSDPSSFTSELGNFQSMIVNGTHGLAYTHIPDCDVLTYPNRLGGSAEDKSENIANFDATYDQLQYEKNVMVHMAPQVATVAELPTECTLDKSFGAFIDPVPMVPELAVSGRSDILYFNPTLDQQIFALAESIAASSAGTSTVLLMHDSVSGAVASAAAQAFYTWGISGPSTARFASDTLDSTALAKGASANFLIVLGVQTTAEAQAIVAFLAANSAVTVMLEYQEYTRHYLALSAHASYSPSLASRIVFASSFPPLMGNTTVLERNFHLNLGADVAPTPLLQQGYIMGRALASILERMSKGTSGFEFLETLLKTAVVGIEGGIRFGPLSNVSEEGSGGCPMGARSVFVQSSSAVKDLGTTVFTSCSVPYTYPGSAALTTAFLVMIIVLTFLLAVVIIFALFFAKGSSSVRDTTNAPKDSSKPFAVMFTDIQASTTLWSRLPADMGPALDKHHELIRNLIAKHKAYEVKTIGDAFLIVHTDPSILLQLAEELQEDFFQFKWGTDRFDKVYQEAELEEYESAVTENRGASNEELVTATVAAEPPSANDPSYTDKWNGLRVRTGIHFGSGEVQFDKVAKGYDYYGTVVNTASRVEASARGGQIMLSGAVLDYLNHKGSALGPQQVKSMGPVMLRGVGTPTELYQVNFRDRKYKPLSITAFEEEEGERDDLQSRMDEGFSQAGSYDARSAHYEDDVAMKFLNRGTQRLKAELQHSHSFVTLLFSPSPDAEKREMIKKLATRWRVNQNKYHDKKMADDVLLEWRIWSLVDRLTRVHQEANGAWTGGGGGGGGARHSSDPSGNLNRPSTTGSSFSHPRHSAISSIRDTGSNLESRSSLAQPPMAAVPSQ